MKGGGRKGRPAVLYVHERHGVYWGNRQMDINEINRLTYALRGELERRGYQVLVAYGDRHWVKGVDPTDLAEAYRTVRDRAGRVLN